ncbi:MAG: 3-deoxy-7-phosphoheptulonate synthase, partial [Chitinivibrionales bacterium]|nr:3-deoxy-7-phosphoheptulonate synthase [Chitinivibrionales bacterium]
MSTSIRTKPLADWGMQVGRTLLIAGPCSAESEGQMVRTARKLRECGVSVLRAGVWKPRTRPGTYEGPGHEGLAWLVQAGREAGLKTATEVATPEHVEMCLLAGVDILWVGARTSGNPFAVQA